MIQNKILIALAALAITSVSIAQNKTAASWFFGATSPIYAGGYSKSNKINITLRDSLKGSILYDGRELQLPSFTITYSTITSNDGQASYDLYDKKLKIIVCTNTENQQLKIVRIPDNNGYLYRVLAENSEIIIYDQNLDFINQNIDTKTLIMQYTNTYYKIPRNKKKQIRLIEEIVKDQQTKKFVSTWLLNNV